MNDKVFVGTFGGIRGKVCVFHFRPDGVDGEGATAWWALRPAEQIT